MLTRHFTLLKNC